MFKTIRIILVMIITLLLGILRMSSQDIYSAVREGDIAGVKEFLSADPALLDARNSEALTPLNLAASIQRLEIARMLLEMGADPYLGDRENSAPIHLAAISGDKDMVDLFLDAGIDIDLKDDNGSTPLLFAISYGQPDMAKYLIGKGADVNTQNSFSASPLLYAVARGYPDVVELLISKKADVNDRTRGGSTILHTAVSYGRLDMVKLLIANGARLETETDDGAQPLAWALNANTEEVASFLVDHGADVMHRNNFGITALHSVASRGTIVMAQFLLDHGADVNAVTKDGRTPLTFAAYSDNAGDISKFLILNGADVNPDPCKIDKSCTCGPYFSTPLLTATRFNKMEMVKNLVSSGARINTYDQEGFTPLHYAVMTGDINLVGYLLDHGAFLDVPDRITGGTELHLAVAMGYGEISDYLIEEGSSPGLEDNSGKTPLDYAFTYGHELIAYSLLAEGAPDKDLAAYINTPSMLERPLQDGQAVIWFLGHSGWAIKTANHFLVFDYFMDERLVNPDDSCLASGFINPAEIRYQDVTVFSTHSHRDHYDPVIYSWASDIPEISYVFCWDPLEAGQEYTVIPVHEKKQVDGMDIYVNHSTDLGGGYLVEVDGLVIFHMGDHANGEDGLMDEFTDEIDLVAAMDKDIDILFGGIRGCSLGQPEQVKKGIYYTLEELQPEWFLPMHSGSHSLSYGDFVNTARVNGIEQEMKYPVHKGDRFFYDKNGPSELVSE